MLSTHEGLDGWPANLRSDVFMPPQTPMASSPSQSTHLMTSSSRERGKPSNQNSTRKRPRHDSYEISLSNTKSIEWSATTDSTTAAESNLYSPAPFVNTRYILAGGLDTPGIKEAALHERADSQYDDNTYRTNLGWNSEPYTEDRASFFPHTNHSTISEPQVVREISVSAKGWGKAAFEVVGDVVGKVWSFCTASAFRGFAAGGGTQYNEMARPLATPEASFPTVQSSSQQEGMEWSIASLPGRFPGEDAVSAYMYPPALNNDSPQRPAKRRQVSSSRGDDLTTNWVVVDSATGQSTSSSGTGCSKRKTPFAQSRPGSPGAGRRPVSSTASKPASRAGMKRTLPAASRASVSHAGSPALHSHRPASFAPPRSPTSRRLFESSTSPRRATSTHPGHSSPAAIEAQKWASKRRQQEREADQSMMRFNKQLRDMIREGKAALGSKIEVEIDAEDEDEGFEDGDYHNDEWKI